MRRETKRSKTCWAARPSPTLRRVTRSLKETKEHRGSVGHVKWTGDYCHLSFVTCPMQMTNDQAPMTNDQTKLKSKMRMIQTGCVVLLGLHVVASGGWSRIAMADEANKEIEVVLSRQAEAWNRG